VSTISRQLHVEAKEWKEAFALAEQYPGRFDETVFLPYAEWLAIEDKFEEAQAAYERFGRLDLAVKIMQQLTHNAVVENRFADAANGYYRLAEEHVRIAQKAADGSCFPLSHCLPCCFTTVQ
jgi:intraflagellar transport protein 122